MNIPDDVMQAAREAAEWAEGLYVDDLTDSEKQEVVDAIADKIMAERERCARVAEAHKLLEHPLSPGSEINAWWSGQERARIAIAAAIRRGEA